MSVLLRTAFIGRLINPSNSAEKNSYTPLPTATNAVIPNEGNEAEKGSNETKSDTRQEVQQYLQIFMKPNKFNDENIATNIRKEAHMNLKLAQKIYKICCEIQDWFPWYSS